MEEQSTSLFLVAFPFFSLQQKICGIWGEKRKEKLLGLECKTTGLKKKKEVFIFLQSLFFFQWEPRLSNAGLCWQLGAVEKIALYGRSLLIWKQQGPWTQGSLRAGGWRVWGWETTDSHVFL